MRNYGIVDHGPNSALVLQGATTVSIVNAADGLWIASDGTITSNGAGTSTFANAGLLRKATGGSGFDLTGHVAYTSTGTIDVLSGQLRVTHNGGGSSLTTAVSSPSPPACSSTSTTSRWPPARPSAAAALLFMNGTTTVTANPITVTLPTTLNGTLTGPGTLNMAAAMTVIGGTVSLAGGLDSPRRAAPSPSSTAPGPSLSATSLRNHGIVTMAPATVPMVLQGATTVAIVNAADGLWTTSDGTITSNGAGTLTFANAGLLRKATGGSGFDLTGHIAYTSTGTIDVLSGQLRVTNNGGGSTLTNSGLITVADGTQFDLDHVTLAAGSTFSGGGLLFMNGTTTVTGALVVNTPTTLNGTLNGSGAITMAAADDVAGWRGVTGWRARDQRRSDVEPQFRPADDRLFFAELRHRELGRWQFPELHRWLDYRQE